MEAVLPTIGRQSVCMVFMYLPLTKIHELRDMDHYIIIIRPADNYLILSSFIKRNYPYLTNCIKMI